MPADLGPVLAVVPDEWTKGIDIAKAAAIDPRTAGPKLAALERQGFVVSSYDQGARVSVYRRGPKAPPLPPPGPSRADILSGLLDFAFDELLWISEAPNRGDVDGTTLELAVRARDACARLEREDPEKEYTGP